METDLQLAQRMALVGAGVALPHFARLAELPQERKSDGSIVTAADRAVEAAIRSVLAEARPGDAVLGEEEGETSTGTGGRRWIIDPIDGTHLFVTGDDRWLVLIGLEQDGEMVAGVAAHPAQGSIWWATRGGGAFEGRVVGGRVVAETRIRVVSRSSAPAVPDGAGVPARLDAVGVPAGLDAVGESAASVSDASGESAASVLAGSRLGIVPEDWAPELVAPLKAVTPARPWAIHPALLVARGELDVAVQTGGQIWDFAATSLIVSEAGGTYRGLAGNRNPGPGASVYARDEATGLAALALLAPPA